MTAAVNADDITSTTTKTVPEACTSAAVKQDAVLSQGVPRDAAANFGRLYIRVFSGIGRFSLR